MGSAARVLAALLTAIGHLAGGGRCPTSPCWSCCSRCSPASSARWPSARGARRARSGCSLRRAARAPRGAVGAAPGRRAAPCWPRTPGPRCSPRPRCATPIGRLAVVAALGRVLPRRSPALCADRPLATRATPVAAVAAPRVRAARRRFRAALRWGADPAPAPLPTHRSTPLSRNPAPSRHPVVTIALVRWRGRPRRSPTSPPSPPAPSRAATASSHCASPTSPTRPAPSSFEVTLPTDHPLQLVRTTPRRAGPPPSTKAALNPPGQAARRTRHRGHQHRHLDREPGHPIGPGEFPDFPLSLGPAARRCRRGRLPAVQTYDDGGRRLGPARQPDGSEPERPRRPAR